MVKSLLNSTINYPEQKTLYEEDKGHEASIYKAEILDEDVIIALGQCKYIYIDSNVLFYPIYLVKNNKVTIQIGVYEVPAGDAATIIDDEGDVDVSLLGEPLLFPFIGKSILKDDTTKNDDAFASGAATASVVGEQTSADALKEKETFKDSKDLPWIQKFMQNNYYKIINNEGKGECLFATIRDGLKTIGINTSVDNMRKVLALNATNEVYLNYKELYERGLEEDKIITREIKVLTDRHNDLKKQIQVEKERNTQLAIIAQAEEIIKRLKELKRDRAGTKSMIEEFKFIKGIKDLEMFKLKLQTCEFWGDTWAISTLERALNVKLILMSRASFKGKDVDNVLTCGQLNDASAEGTEGTEGTTFTPNHYIILDYDGSHYQLITYKDRGAFTFKELPYDIKMLVVDKCLERQAGPYYSIPDFKEFMKKLPAANAQTQAAAAQAQAAAAQAAVEIIQTDLYDQATIFQFYLNSLDAPAPGKGAGESVGPEGHKFYSELAKIPSWRRKLSHFWESEFTLDGKKWRSVEHYYQGSKFKRTNPDFYAQFSLDSGSALSKDILMANAAGSKNGKYKGELVRPKNIAMDKDFFEVRETGMTRANLEMQAALMAKFSQNEELKRLLKATKKAKLNHFSRGSPPEVFTDLMIVRKTLSQ
jgi:predicted NAD-dependent protein-ADP-ribosyltransferase YbiA (DUF1768 family)